MIETMSKPQGRPARMVDVLGSHLKTRRVDAGIKPAKIASHADVDQETVRNFENGRLVRRLDEVVEAYAEELGVKPADLWLEASEKLKQPTAGSDDESRKDKPGSTNSLRKSAASMQASQQKRSQPRRRRQPAQD